VPYSNRATAQQYGGVDRAQATQAREQFRGREASPQGAFGDTSRGANRDATGSNRTPGNTAGTREAANRDANRSGTRDAANRDANRSGTRNAAPSQNRGGSGAFSGVEGGNSTREASNRGNASRSSGGGQASRPSGGGQTSRPSGGGGASRGGGRR
jgi:translation initiation factor IF-2